MRLTRLSPKPIFFAIVALGLPFAVTVGWNLAEPATTTTPPPPAAAPAGAGGIGTAPPRVPTSTPVTVGYSSRTARAAAGRPASGHGRTTVRPKASSTARSPGLPLPTPADPPVPTPTAVTTAPTSPSPTPPVSATAEPTGGAPGLIRR